MRLIGLVFALALLATDANAQALRPQPSAKIPSVGVLYPGVPDAAIGAAKGYSAVFALQDGLRELGYVDGQNIALEYRWARGKFVVNLKTARTLGLVISQPLLLRADQVIE